MSHAIQEIMKGEWSRGRVEHINTVHGAPLPLSFSLSLSLYLFLHLLQAIISNNLHSELTNLIEPLPPLFQGRSMLFKIHKIPVFAPVPQSNWIQSAFILNPSSPWSSKSSIYLKKPLENPSTPISRNPDTIEGISPGDCRFSQFCRCCLRFEKTRLREGAPFQFGYRSP